MLERKVISICGKEVIVDESTRKLYDFNNKTKTITYSAQRLDDRGLGLLHPKRHYKRH